MLGDRHLIQNLRVFVCFLCVLSLYPGFQWRLEISILASVTVAKCVLVLEFPRTLNCNETLGFWDDYYILRKLFI